MNVMRKILNMKSMLTYLNPKQNTALYYGLVSVIAGVIMILAIFLITGQ